MLFRSVSPVFMRMILSSLFIKSCGSWSSGFPVNEQLDMSAMFILSWFVLRLESGDASLFWLLPCSVHEAGENVNWEDWEESVRSDEKSSESWEGVVPRVGGRKRSSSSRRMFPKDCRGANLVQDVSFVS